MPLTPTLIALAAAIVVAVFSGWRGARPVDLRRGPRMVPWRFIMLLAVTLGLLLAVHLVQVL